MNKNLKICSLCKEEKTSDEFINHKLKNKISSFCKNCNKIRLNSINKKYRLKNKEKISAYKKTKKYKILNKLNREKNKEKRKLTNLKYKLDAFNAYGGAFCSCCGEKEVYFLAIDHVNGGGRKERKKSGRHGHHMYRWLKKNNYPDCYRVLCHNCNFSVHLNNGKCEHNSTDENKILTFENNLSRSLYMKQYRFKLKIEVLKKYGGVFCSCCKIDKISFLVIDHIEGGGTKHTKEVGHGHKFYLWLKKNNYPSGFRVLCHNCNWGNYINNYNCPHNIK